MYFRVLIYFNYQDIIDSSLLLAKSSTKIDPFKPSEYILSVDSFEPTVNINVAALASEAAAKTSGSHHSASNGDGGISDTTSNLQKLASINESAAASSLSNGVRDSPAHRSASMAFRSAADRRSRASGIGVPSASGSAAGAASASSNRKRVELLRSHDEFKSFMFVYPKSLKYDTQKTFSRARNILVRTELRDDDSAALASDSVQSAAVSNALKVKFYLNNK